jgi:uncharacterized damage-inducible protein DinB
MNASGEPNPIGLMVGYTAWAGAVVLHSCAGLRDEQLQRDLGGTQGSLLNLLRHVYDSEKRWLVMLTERKCHHSTSSVVIPSAMLQRRSPA